MCSGRGALVARVGRGVLVARVGRGARVARVGRGARVVRVGRGALVAVKVGCRELRWGCWCLLTWRTLKHELAREKATQSRGARQKPPDHEVGNTVRNDRDVDDASPPAHTKGTRDAGETASKAPSVKRQGSGRARRAGRHCRGSTVGTHVYRMRTSGRPAAAWALSC